MPQGDSGRPGRRKVLKAISGTAAVPLVTRTVTGTTDNETVKIITARGGPNDEPIERKTVPAVWRNHELAMRQVNAQIARRYGHLPNVVSVARGPSTRSHNGFRFTQQIIRVQAGTSSSVRPRLPSTLDVADVSVPSSVVVRDVRIEEVSDRPTLTASPCTGKESPDPYPGGLFLGRAQAADFGTAGYRVYDNSTEYVLTANHVLTDDCKVANSRGEKYNDIDLGAVADGHAVHDWALVPPRSFQSIKNAIWTESGEWPITGYKTRSGLEALIGEDVVLKKQGVMTGYLDATLESIDDCSSTTCVRMDCEGFRVNSYAAKGDSGGPVWEFASGGDALIVGHGVFGRNSLGTGTCSSTEVFDKAIGWPAYKIVNNNPYHIG